MPPPIFVRYSSSSDEKKEKNKDNFGKIKVRDTKITAVPNGLQTFAIILPNTIHGCKKHLK